MQRVRKSLIIEFHLNWNIAMQLRSCYLTNYHLWNGLRVDDSLKNTIFLDKDWGNFFPLLFGLTLLWRCWVFLLSPSPVHNNEEGSARIYGISWKNVSVVLSDFHQLFGAHAEIFDVDVEFTSVSLEFKRQNKLKTTWHIMKQRESSLTRRLSQLCIFMKMMIIVKS